MANHIHRRELLLTAAVAGLALPRNAVAQDKEPQSSRVRYCLNMSTVREHKLSLVEKIDLAAQAGYDAIEPWTGDLQQFADGGGSLDDLKKRIADHGMTVESAIAFPHWIVDDDAERAKGMEAAKRDMNLVKRIGGSRIAAPPAGATNEPRLDLLKMADRYRALLEAGAEIGVTPQLEVWGFSKNLTRLGETACVAIESHHPAACILPDVYHLYKGGSDHEGLSLLSGKGIHVLHMNDYPDHPPRAEITDAHRVYPGDGVAPLPHILRLLFANGFSGALSLELFNRDYWRRDPKDVVELGLVRMRAAVEKALQDG